MILRTKLISAGIALLVTTGVSGLASHHSTPASPPPSASVNLNTTCTTSGNTFKITTTNNTSQQVEIESFDIQMTDGNSIVLQGLVKADTGEGYVLDAGASYWIENSDSSVLDLGAIDYNGPSPTACTVLSWNAVGGPLG